MQTLAWLGSREQVELWPLLRSPVPGTLSLCPPLFPFLADSHSSLWLQLARHFPLPVPPLGSLALFISNVCCVAQRSERPFSLQGSLFPDAKNNLCLAPNSDRFNHGIRHLSVSQHPGDSTAWSGLRRTRIQSIREEACLRGRDSLTAHL